MPRIGVCLVLFLAISGCSKPRVPAEATELQTRAAEFRHRVLARNVKTALEDLTAKLDEKWQEHNQVLFEFSVYKKRQERDAKINKEGATIEDVKKAHVEYEAEFDKLREQFKNANDLNTKKLKKYKVDVLAKIMDQFDRSEQADIILVRYMMGLKPGPFDSFVVGKPQIISTEMIEAALSGKDK